MYALKYETGILWSAPMWLEENMHKVGFARLVKQNVLNILQCFDSEFYVHRLPKRHHRKVHRNQRFFLGKQMCQSPVHSPGRSPVEDAMQNQYR